MCVLACLKPRCARCTARLPPRCAACYSQPCQRAPLDAALSTGARAQVSQAGLKLEEAKTKKLLGCARATQRATQLSVRAGLKASHAPELHLAARAGSELHLTALAPRRHSDFPFQTIVSWSHPQRTVRPSRPRGGA